MKQIPLSRGLFATVDDEDFDWLSQWKWCAVRAHKGNGVERFYAARVQVIDGKQKMILMHRAITGAPKGKVVDHRDRATLNNQRANLRVCTQGDNSQNQAGHFDRGKSRFKGVYWHSQNHRWVASFRGKHLGCFDDEEAAARAYDVAAQAFSPEFCALNFDENGNAVTSHKPAFFGEVRSRKVHSSGYKGVSWHGATKKWVVTVKGKYLGLFESKDEAVIFARYKLTEADHVKPI